MSRVFIALSLGVSFGLGGCGTGRSNAREAVGLENGKATARSAAISFRLSAAGQTLLALDGTGLHVAESVAPVLGAPSLSVDGHRFGAMLPLLWLPGKEVRVAPTAPRYDPVSGLACSVSAELAALSALVKNGGTREIEPPSLSTAASVCATKRALRCYLALWDAPADSDGRTLAQLWSESVGKGGLSNVSADVSFSLAQAAQKALACALPSTGEPSQRTPEKASFILTGTSLLFSPSPLATISIYEGRLTDYDEALVNRTPIATVSVPETCGSPSRACLNSPLPRAQCRKCDKLKAGVTYTAFLSERTGQRHSEIKAVTFVR